MAYLITHFWPGATEAQYRATVAVVHPPGGLPEGQLYHAAGPDRRRLPDRGRVGLEGAVTTRSCARS